MSENSAIAALSGIIFIDKPINVTSIAVVRKVKKTFQISRVGHLGTLDPFATGLLPIMIGATTRLSDEFMDLDKQYLFTIKFGIETDTLDTMGSVIKETDVPDLSKEKILHTLQLFTGHIQQTPPVYSALKMNGRPLYEYMRATGKLPFDIETKNRKVHIKKFELVNFNEQLLEQTKQTDQAHNRIQSITLRVVCSKGTYVRSLARDIAYELDTVGMCSELRREKIGSWCASQASPISELSEKNIISPTELLPNVPKFEFPVNYFAKLNTGNVFVFEKIQHPDLFDTVNQFSQKNPETKFFAGIENNINLLFLALAEYKEENKIIIKPQKKII